MDSTSQKLHDERGRAGTPEASEKPSEDLAPLRESGRRDEESRLAALNLMEDAIQAQRAAETLSAELRRENAERKQAEDASRRSRQELVDFIENAPVAMHWAGPDGIILWANRTELEMLGYTKEEYIGRHVAELHADRPVIEDIFQRLTNRGTLRDREARLRCKDGSIRHVLISCDVLWEGDKFAQTRCFTRDITERKQADEALARLAAIVNSSDDAIVSKSLEGIVTSWNRGAERIFGYSAAEAVGRHISLIIPEERRAEEDQVLGKIRRGEIVDHFETLRRTKDGRRLRISLTVSPIRDAQGRIIGASKVARDITERHRAQMLAQGQKGAFQAAVNGASLETSLDVLVRTAMEQTDNDAWAAFFLVDADGSCLRPLTGTPGMFESYAKCVDGFAIGPSSPSCGSVAHSGRAVIVKDVAEDPLWAPWLQVARDHNFRACWSFPIQTEHGKVIGTFAMYFKEPRDAGPGDLELAGGLTQAASIIISRNAEAEERRRVEEALRRSEAQLREADRRKDEFIAMLAHELRNPLSALGMSAELLGRARIEDKRARIAVPAVARQTSQLRRIADDLLDMARVTHGKLVLQRRPVNLLEAAGNVAADYSAHPRTATVIEVFGDAAWVDADPARVHQMISNLVENAVKYGGRRVTLRVSRDGQWGRLAVRDDGQGIAPDLLADLFTPFVQGKQSLEREQGGLGLGLALVDRLASLHGGGITAHSEGPGRGSTFTLSLPGTKPAVRAARPSAFKRARARILVIEDEEDSRECLRLLLETDGHEVSLADNGADGLAKLAALRPDIALVDVGLPGMDGYEIARRARALRGGRRIKLIAITGYGGEKDRRRARKSGFDLHITKPVSYEQLVKALGVPAEL